VHARDLQRNPKPPSTHAARPSQAPHLAPLPAPNSPPPPHPPPPSYPTASPVINFPNHRGYALGVLKSFAGLSASVFTTLYIAVLAPDAASFLLVLA
jgi:hypothetical protein